MHEGYKNGKSYLPGSYILLQLLDSFRRQTVPSRIAVLLGGQRMRFVEVLELTVLCPHRRAQRGEHVPRRAGTVLPRRFQFCLDHHQTGEERAHPVIGRGQMYHVRSIKLTNSPGRMRQGDMCSGHCPSSRADLLMIGKHSFS